MFVDSLIGGGGVVFNEVCADLEREGYAVQPFLIPAASVNAPHQRQRVWFVAYSNMLGCSWQRRERSFNKERKESDKRPGKLGRHKFKGWEKCSTLSPICGGDDGLPRELDNITFPKWRKESIKAYGNAIVPQVAYQIFKAICNSETIKST